MKHADTSKPFFSQADVAAALAAAQANPPVFDPENPPTTDADWEGAIASRSLPQLREKLAMRQRGPGHAPPKIPATIRFDHDVLDGLRATGRGWQTRVNEVMKEWLRRHFSA